MSIENVDFYKFLSAPFLKKKRLKVK